MRIFDTRKTMRRFADLSDGLMGEEKAKFSEDVKALFWEKNLTDNYNEFFVTEEDVNNLYN